MATIISKLKYL